MMPNTLTFNQIFIMQNDSPHFKPHHKILQTPKNRPVENICIYSVCSEARQ